jgi:probable dihydroxyacetone kinase regulator
VPDSQITKHALSSAMKELMAELPMEKIKIGDIVERCNMNRQSFYYHFKDKYDLVNWIYYTDFFMDIQSSLEKPSWELIEKICEFFYENRRFYSNALKVTGQNSFSEYFTEIMHPLLLSHCEGFFENDKDRDFYATFFADAIRVSITRWLLEGAKIPAAEYVKLMKTAATGIIYEVVVDWKNNQARNIY